MADDKYEVQTIGDGITERRKAVWKPGGKAQDPQTVSDRIRQTIANNQRFFADPWAAYRPMHQEICKHYDQLRASISRDELHNQLSGSNERKSRAWYLREMARMGNCVNSAMEKGDASASAYWAFEFAQAVTEYNIIIAKDWNRYAKAGKKSIEGAESTRKGQQSERVRQVDALVADGTKKTAAFAIVAERNGVTAKAIETDYYKAKRKAS